MWIWPSPGSVRDEEKAVEDRRSRYRQGAGGAGRIYRLLVVTSRKGFIKARAGQLTRSLTSKSRQLRQERHGDAMAELERSLAVRMQLGI